MTTKSPDKFYSPICRVSKWDLSGCNALEFWLKPDGSGRAVLVDLNIANSQGKNIHDLWDYVYLPKKGDTAPRIVTVPYFADRRFIGRGTASPFSLSWKQNFEGEYTVEATAYDNRGAKAYAKPVVITVVGRPTVERN